MTVQTQRFELINKEVFASQGISQLFDDLRRVTVMPMVRTSRVIIRARVCAASRAYALACGPVWRDVDDGSMEASHRGTHADASVFTAGKQAQSR